MTVHFYDKIQLRIVTLCPRDIAAMSFKYLRSINHLDLSTNEYSFCMKSVFTREGIRKWHQPKRRILYEYNLELPAGLYKRPSKEKFAIVKEHCFHLWEMGFYGKLHNLCLERHIVEAINSRKTGKIKRVKRFMKTIQLLNFHRFSDAALYLYDNILPILKKGCCRDSKFVIRFSNLFSFLWWVLNRDDAVLLQYVLINAQNVRSSMTLSLFMEWKMDPVTACFFRNKTMHVPVLLRFGVPSAFPCAYNFILNFRGEQLYREIMSRNADQRRAYFLFQLWLDFRWHRKSPEALRCIWRCVNDPFLSLTEIRYTFSSLCGSQTVTCLISYYEMFIIGRVCSSKPSPRTLKDICRVEIRRLLNFHHQLPFGVYDLQIPEVLKLYLNLFL